MPGSRFENDSRFEKLQTIASILSLAVGGALGLVGWRLGDNNVGYFLGSFLVAQGLISLAHYLGDYRAITATLPKLVGGRTIFLAPGTGMQGLVSVLASGDSLIIVPASRDISEAAEMAEKCSRRCPTTIVLPPESLSTPAHHSGLSALFALTEPAFTAAVLKSDSGNRFLIYLRSQGHWIMMPDDAGIDELSAQYLESILPKTFDPARAVDPEWLSKNIREASDIWQITQEALARGRVECITPNAIYSEQLRLSDGAKAISALDMTEISEWLEPHGLGGCMALNVKSAAQYGMAAVRRIIFVPSREYITSRPEYAKSLRKVLSLHMDNNVSIGLIFQTDIADKSLVIDSVLYRSSVLWVETTPTTRFAGTGYFTTLETDVRAFNKKFEALWRGEYCPNPVQEARRFADTFPIVP